MRHIPVVQLRYDSRTEIWAVCLLDVHGRWHPYTGCVPSRDISRLIGTLERDQSNIFGEDEDGDAKTERSLKG